MFRLWGFRSPRDVAAAFGPLERRVLEAVWEQGEVSVRDVHASLGAPTAYTTLMTTLDRLYRKGVLARRKRGRAYLYHAAVAREELERSVADDLVRGILGEGSEAAQPLLSSLVEAVSQRDRQLLDELDRLIREKRRALRGGR